MAKYTKDELAKIGLEFLQQTMPNIEHEMIGDEFEKEEPKKEKKTELQKNFEYVLKVYNYAKASNIMPSPAALYDIARKRFGFRFIEDTFDDILMELYTNKLFDEENGLWFPAQKPEFVQASKLLQNKEAE